MDSETITKLKKRIISKAYLLNIDLIGFTTASRFDRLENILNERKKRNYLSEFEEDNLEVRVDPRKTLKTAKSIIVIGQSYYSTSNSCQNAKDWSKLQGDFARISWGKDYHIVLKKKLDELGSYISSEHFKFEFLSFVDTGPLVDRHLAWRAGLGIFGHNNCLINDKFGSWFVIGYMLTNLEIEPDKPKEDNYCINCNVCIRECPTGAIEKPYLINVKKCISHILQSKDNIAEDDRDLLGTQLYGCDRCQSKCPKNFAIAETSLEEFKPRTKRIELIDLLAMSNKKFKKVFKENSSGWRGKKILQRNAIIALGNHKNIAALPYLLPFLTDDRVEMREYAKWAIERIEKST
ncbi:MAG: tRNA epoxyqueuosine(34) reductase QueG [Alkaliphilus sp.]